MIWLGHSLIAALNLPRFIKPPDEIFLVDYYSKCVSSQAFLEAYFSADPFKGRAL